jgi:hypothetical protein
MLVMRISMTNRQVAHAAPRQLVPNDGRTDRNREIGPLHALHLFLSRRPPIVLAHCAESPQTSADSAPAACPPAAAAALVHIAGAIRQHLRQVRCSDGRFLPGAFARALLA